MVQRRRGVSEVAGDEQPRAAERRDERNSRAELTAPRPGGGQRGAGRQRRMVYDALASFRCAALSAA